MCDLELLPIPFRLLTEDKKGAAFPSSSKKVACLATLLIVTAVTTSWLLEEHVHALLFVIRSLHSSWTVSFVKAELHLPSWYPLPRLPPTKPEELLAVMRGD